MLGQINRHSVMLVCSRLPRLYAKSDLLPITREERMLTPGMVHGLISVAIDGLNRPPIMRCAARDRAAHCLFNSTFWPRGKEDRDGRAPYPARGRPACGGPARDRDRAVALAGPGRTQVHPHRPPVPERS